ncbi:MAG TPA: XdhC family protein [Pyrinomonadaceae bacterium]|jgi:xanthine dehydrogenase accessory factor
MSFPDEPTLHQTETIAGAVARVLKRGAVAALATIVDAPPSACDVGAKLLVEESGARAAGTSGDAALDEEIAVQASVFLSSRAEAKTYKVEEFAGGNAKETEGGVGLKEFESVGVESELESGGRLERWKGMRVLFERVEPEPHVVVCGAGHVGAALARLAASVGYSVTLIDDRAEFVTRRRFPEDGIKLVAAEDWRRPLLEAIGTGRGVSVAVVTRGHNEDEECMRAVLLARPDYVGMIGSRRRTNIVLERLRETGVETELLNEVRAPVGLDIGAVTPEEVALAILAEIVAERRGGTGAPLSAWRRK